MSGIFKVIGTLLLLLVVVIVSLYLPPHFMNAGVKWTQRLVFSGTIFSAALFKIIDVAKGDTKSLLARESLTDIQRTTLAKTIRRRSRFLFARFLIILATTAASYGCSYFYNKGYYPIYFLRASFVIACCAIWSLIPVIMAWRDYVVAKETLDNRDCGIPDID